MHELKARVQQGYSRSWVVRKYSRVGLWPSEHILCSRFYPPKARLLDLGCGAGRTTLPLSQRGYAVCGLDLAEPMVRRGRIMARREDVPSWWMVGDAETLPFGSEAFAGVLFSYNGIELVPGLEGKRRVLGEIWRVLEPGGCLIFTTHAFEAFNRFLPFRLRQAGSLLLARGLARFGWRVEMEEREVGEVITPADQNVEVHYLQVLSPRTYRRLLRDIGFELLLTNSRRRIELGRAPGWLADLDGDFKFYVARKREVSRETWDENQDG